MIASLKHKERKMKNTSQEMFGVVDKDNKFIGINGEKEFFWEACNTTSDSVFFLYTQKYANEALKQRKSQFVLQDLRVVKVKLSAEFN